MRTFARQLFFLDFPGTMNHHAAADVKPDMAFSLRVFAVCPEHATQSFRQGLDFAFCFPIAVVVPHGSTTTAVKLDADSAANLFDESLAIVHKGSFSIREPFAPCTSRFRAVDNLAFLSG